MLLSKSTSEMDSMTAQKPALNANATEQQSVAPTPDRLSIDDLEDARPATNAQGGVQKIEAVTLTWSKNSVFLLLILYGGRLLKPPRSTS